MAYEVIIINTDYQHRQSSYCSCCHPPQYRVRRFPDIQKKLRLSQARAFPSISNNRLTLKHIKNKVLHTYRNLIRFYISIPIDGWFVLSIFFDVFGSHGCSVFCSSSFQSLHDGSSMLSCRAFSSNCSAVRPSVCGTVPSCR